MHSYPHGHEARPSPTEPLWGSIKSTRAEIGPERELNLSVAVGVLTAPVATIGQEQSAFRASPQRVQGLDGSFTGRSLNLKL